MQTIKNPISSFISKVFMALTAMFISVVTFAQETKKVDVNIDTDAGGGGNFFASPWVWVVGIAVFILLLVALLRGGSRRDA